MDSAEDSVVFGVVSPRWFVASVSNPSICSVEESDMVWPACSLDLGDPPSDRRPCIGA